MACWERRLPGFMAHSVRIRLAAVVAVAVGLVAVALLSGGGGTGSNPPRLRVSVPGLDNEVDLFADQSEPDGDEGSRSDLIEIDSVDQIQAAFDAGQGHPRLILLVDPI